jgi:general secretion pathway protein L
MKSTKKEHFLLIGPEAPEKVHWAERPAYGAVVTGQGPLAEVLHLRGEKVVVLVAGQDVLLTEVNIPGGGRGRIVKKSLPYALEENLSEDVENLHFAHGPVSKKGVIPVAVAAKERMEAWLGILHEHGIEAKCIVPATMAVPLTPEQWSVVVSEGRFLLRKDAWHGFAGDLASLPLFLGESSGDSTAPPVRLYMDEECLSDCQADLPEMNPVVTRKKPLLQVLAEGFDDKTIINLLQGDYGRTAGWREMWHKWRIPATALILLGFLNIIGFAIDYYTLKGENRELAKRIETIYLKTFPDSRRVVNAKAQMSQKIAELEGAGAARNEFFEVYDKTAPLLLESAGFSLVNLRFNNGRFDFDFEISDLQTLEKLKNNLSNLSGIAMDIKNAEAVGGKVKTKIQIKGR